MNKLQQTTRFKEPDGSTYLVELVEKKRKLILPRDDLIQVIAAMVREVQQIAEEQRDLTLLRLDPAIHLSRKLVEWIQENPDKFETVLEDVKAQRPTSKEEKVKQI